MVPATLHARLGVPRPILYLALPPAFAATLLMGGCFARRARPAVPWAAAGQIRPTLPTRVSTPEIPKDPIPDLQLDLSPPESSLPIAKNSPPRPRVSSAPNAESESRGQPDAPIIVPQLSAQESAVLKQEAAQSLEIAERHLAEISGKPLNATQADLASKVRGFIDQSREASRTGDWTQARNLAKKAQVLSEALANSL
jgi:hypothetical protein